MDCFLSSLELIDFFHLLSFVVLRRPKKKLTSFKQAAKQASLVDVKMRALSWPLIIELGTLSKFHGRLQTLSEKIGQI